MALRTTVRWVVACTLLATTLDAGACGGDDCTPGEYSCDVGQYCSSEGKCVDEGGGGGCSFSDNCCAPDGCCPCGNEGPGPGPGPGPGSGITTSTTTSTGSSSSTGFGGQGGIGGGQGGSLGGGGGLGGTGGALGGAGGV